MIRRGPAMFRAFARILVLVVVSVALLPACSLSPFTLEAPPDPSSPNPPWPRECPLRIALLMDFSGSMDPNLDAVKQSASDLVEALGEKSNEVAVVVFASTADVAVPMTDVGDVDIRRQVKEQIEDLGTTHGSTSWDAALIAARGLQPDVVVLLTDGEPDSLRDAVGAANALKSDGTRVVGLGIGLRSGSVANLVRVTGPTAGDDFYQTGTSGLLDKLYEVASKACGVQVGPLPVPPLVPQPLPPPPLVPPAPGSFPLIEVIAAGLALVLAIGVGGMLLSRRRSAPVAIQKQAAVPLPDPTITLDDLPPVPATLVEDDPATGRPVAPSGDTDIRDIDDDDGAAPGDPQAGRPGRGVRGPRRISLARIQNPDPPHNDGAKGGSGADGSST